MKDLCSRQHSTHEPIIFSLLLVTARNKHAWTTLEGMLNNTLHNLYHVSSNHLISFNCWKTLAKQCENNISHNIYRRKVIKWPQLNNLLEKLTLEMNISVYSLYYILILFLLKQFFTIWCVSLNKSVINKVFMTATRKCTPTIPDLYLNELIVKSNSEICVNTQNRGNKHSYTNIQYWPILMNEKFFWIESDNHFGTDILYILISGGPGHYMLPLNWEKA